MNHHCLVMVDLRHARLTHVVFPAIVPGDVIHQLAVALTEVTPELSPDPYLIEARTIVVMRDGLATGTWHLGDYLSLEGCIEHLPLLVQAWRPGYSRPLQAMSIPYATLADAFQKPKRST